MHQSQIYPMIKYKEKSLVLCSKPNGQPRINTQDYITIHVLSTMLHRHFFHYKIYPKGTVITSFWIDKEKNGSNMKVLRCLPNHQPIGLAQGAAFQKYIWITWLNRWMICHDEMIPLNIRGTNLYETFSNRESTLFFFKGCLHSLVLTYHALQAIILWNIRLTECL